MLKEKLKVINVKKKLNITMFKGFLYLFYFSFLNNYTEYWFKLFFIYGFHFKKFISFMSIPFKYTKYLKFCFFNISIIKKFIFLITRSINIFWDISFCILFELFNFKLEIFNCKKLNVNFFYKKKEIKLKFYDAFILKIDFLAFLLFRKYVEYFRRFKYNEYIRNCNFCKNDSILLKKHLLYKVPNLIRNPYWNIDSQLRFDMRKFLYLKKYKIYNFSYVKYHKYSKSIFNRWEVSSFCSFYYSIISHKILYKSFKDFFVLYFYDYFLLFFYYSTLTSRKFFWTQRQTIENISDLFWYYNIYNNNRSVTLYHYMYHLLDKKFNKRVLKNFSVNHSYFIQSLNINLDLFRLEKHRFNYNVIFLLFLNYIDYAFFSYFSHFDILKTGDTDFYDFMLFFIRRFMLGFIRLVDSYLIFDFNLYLDFYKYHLDLFLWLLFNLPYNYIYQDLVFDFKNIVTLVDSTNIYKNNIFNKFLINDLFFKNHIFNNCTQFFFIKNFFGYSILRDFFFKIFGLSSFLSNIILCKFSIQFCYYLRKFSKNEFIFFLERSVLHLNFLKLIPHYNTSNYIFFQDMSNIK